MHPTTYFHRWAIKTYQAAGIGPPRERRSLSGGLVVDLLGIHAEDVGTFDPDVYTSMLALAPAIRANLVFVEEDPRKPAREALTPLSRIPRALVLLSVLAQVAKAAGMRRVTPQTIWSLYTPAFADTTPRSPARTPARSRRTPPRTQTSAGRPGPATSSVPPTNHLKLPTRTG